MYLLCIIMIVLGGGGVTMVLPIASAYTCPGKFLPNSLLSVGTDVQDFIYGDNLPNYIDGR